MRLVIILAALAIGVHAAEAQDTASQGRMDAMMQRAKDWLPNLPSLPSKDWLPNLPSIPSIPGLQIPDFDTFIKQVADTLPILEQMGYEVTTFRVQWGLPPKAKLRLRSTTVPDPVKIKDIEDKAPRGLLSSALVSGAATAKTIQSTMRLGTAIIDVDFALPPKVRMSFLKETKGSGERDIEDLDLACGQAL